MATVPPTQPTDGTAPAALAPAAPAVPTVAPTPTAATLKDVWTLEGQATHAGVPVANAPITVYDALTDAPAGSTPDGLIVVGGELKTDAEGRYRVSLANLKPGRAARLFVDGGAWSLSTVARAGDPAATPTYRVQTQFVVYVDPKTGQTSMIVAAGVVKAPLDEKGTALDLLTRGATKTTLIYPSQQINLDGRREVEDLKTKVGQIDPADLLSAAVSNKVIEAIIKNKAEIDQENREFLERQKQELENRVKQDPTVSQTLKTRDDLDTIQRNLDNLVGNIAKEAIAQKKIDQKLVDNLIKDVDQKLKDPDKKVDLSKVEQLDKVAGVDPALELLKKQAELERLRAENKPQEAAELELMLENQRRLAALLARLEAEKKGLEEANKDALEDAKKRAEAQLKAQLDKALQEALERQQALVRKEQETLKKADELAQKAGVQQLLQRVTEAILEAVAQAAQANGKTPLPPDVAQQLKIGIPLSGVAGGTATVTGGQNGLVLTGARGRQVDLNAPGDGLRQQLGQALSPPKSSGGGNRQPAGATLKMGALGFNSAAIDDEYRFNWSVGDGVTEAPFKASFGDEPAVDVLLDLVAEDNSRAALTLSMGGHEQMHVVFDFSGATAGGDTLPPVEGSSFLTRVALADVEGDDIYRVDPELATSAPTRWTSYPGAESAHTHSAFLDAWGHQNEIVLDAEGNLLAGRIWYRQPPTLELPPIETYRVLSEEAPFQRIDFWRAPVTN
jgi:hypothetical protein